MIPKHANPYFLTEQTTVVSRSALREDSDDELGPPEADPERAEMLARLENILKRSIEDVLPSTTRAGGDVESTDPPRKKKRRKVEEAIAPTQQEEQPVAVPFRLLSGTAQPKPIVLAPKAPRVIVAIAPAFEDTAEEAERRAARAREVAVDFDWVVSESRKPYLPPPNAAKKLRNVVASIPSPEPRLLLLQVPKPTPKPPRASLADPSVPIEPSPHAHDTSCCPIVDVPPAEPLTDATRKRKRRRGKARDGPAVQPAFWRPGEGMGGKSWGYAWGYEGSWPLAPDETPRYRRDTMRKAVFE
ncbi:hypothetical protein C8Q77DRAFT_1155796 [Trametes polyzona]|nr:hypothetical protein C8Q77DRAFT_1155796 [Trametes polyzona]